MEQGEGEKGGQRTGTKAVFGGILWNKQGGLSSWPHDIQEILQNHEKREVTGFLVKTSKGAKFCIMVFVGSKIETLSSGAGAWLREDLEALSWWESPEILGTSPPPGN